MKDGLEAVKTDDYEVALGHFKLAQAEVTDDKLANIAIEQTELTILAEMAAAEDGLQAALPYYEKIASLENGIEHLTSMAREKVLHILELEEQIEEVKYFPELDESEAASETWSE